MSAHPDLVRGVPPTRVERAAPVDRAVPTGVMAPERSQASPMPARASVRRPYIDWLRGVAVLFMILWHSIDAWTVTDGRDNRVFWIIAFLAGWAAPLFLFLAGLAVPFAASARMARGADRLATSRALQRRGWQIFLLAHLFRVQSFLLNPNGSWSGILKPDVLNVLGLGLVLAAFLWRRATSFRSAQRWLLVPAVMTVAVTPWARLWWWPTLLHPRLEAYIRPVGTNGQFTLFPALGFLLAGAFVGWLMNDGGTSEARLHRRLGMAGAAALVAGVAVFIATGPARSLLVDVLSVFVFRTGAMTLALAVAWRLLRGRATTGPLVVLGRASLIVYWVHVELAYGVFSYPLHRALPLQWSIPACLLLITAMYGLAVVWLRRSHGDPAVPAHMAAAWPRHPWRAA